MLLQFTFANHRSFRDEATLSMVSASWAGEGVPAPVQLASIYGANAAGKSNVVSALETLKRVISRGTQKSTEHLPLQPFRLRAPDPTLGSRFELVFVIGSSTYTYGICASVVAVHEEWLLRGFGPTASPIFERDGQAITFGTGVFADSTRADLGKLVAAGTRPNQPFVREAEARNLSEVAMVTEWLDRHVQVIRPGQTFPSLGDTLAEDDDFRAFAAGLLSGADTGISEILVHEEEVLSRAAFHETFAQALLRRWSLAKGLRDELGLPEDDAENEAFANLKRSRISLVHRGGEGRSFPLEFEDESDGTQRLLHLAPALWEGNGRDLDLLVVDGLDRSLHPEVAIHFVREFRRRRPTGQLIFTTHNTHLLRHDVLKPDQVWFAEKGGDGGSRLYSLAEFEPVQLEELDREQGGFAAGYLEGRFGGVPRIRGKWEGDA